MRVIGRCVGTNLPVNECRSDVSAVHNSDSDSGVLGLGTVAYAYGPPCFSPVTTSPALP